MNFISATKAAWADGKCLCVGLDPDFTKMPASRDATYERIVDFLVPIIDATADIAGFFKPNSAFFEAEGLEGMRALADVCAHVKGKGLPIILDAKRGDIGNTNEGYARMAFDWLHVDAITVHPYQGGDSLAPFFSRTEKGIFVLVKTSNHGSGEFQDLMVDGEPLYMRMARTTQVWNTRGNCGVVVGSTYPQEIAAVRGVIGEMPILMPGVGAQGGDVVASVKAGRTPEGGMIINASRSILYASQGKDFPDAARKSAQDVDSAIRKALLE